MRVCGLPLLLCLILVACDDVDPEVQASRVLALDNGCDVRSNCVGRYEGLSVSVRMAPQRSALKPFNVTLSSNVVLEAVTVSLEMQGMDMGQNRYRLLGGEDRTWQAEITLPVCVSGRSDWVAVFELLASDGRYRLSVPFTLGD